MTRRRPREPSGCCKCSAAGSGQWLAQAFTDIKIHHTVHLRLVCFTTDHSKSHLEKVGVLFRSFIDFEGEGAGAGERNMDREPDLNETGACALTRNLTGNPSVHDRCPTNRVTPAEAKP